MLRPTNEEMSRRPVPGLCASCSHAKEISSSKGATFIRCERSFTDPQFPRYPALPVERCSGYEPRDSGVVEKSLHL